MNTSNPNIRRYAGDVPQLLSFDKLNDEIMVIDKSAKQVKRQTIQSFIENFLNELSSTATIASITNTDSPYTILATDQVIFCDTSSGDITVNLPSSASIIGKNYIVKKTVSANKVIVNTSAAETINGRETLDILAENSTLNLYSSGSGWEIVNTEKRDKQVYVDNLEDFPTPVSNVITLADDTAYLITSRIDLSNNRIVCGANTSIIGYGAEMSELHSNIPGAALITANQTIKIRDITLYVEGAGATILDLDASTSPSSNNALDWRLVNFSGGDIGTIQDYDNVILDTIGIIDKSGDGYPAIGNGFIFDGTLGTVAFSNSFFGGLSGSDTAITVPATATLTRRLRIDQSAFVITGSANGIDVNASATVPAEGFILETVNFAGGGTYLAGIGETDDKALFRGCRGIPNTAVKGYYTMQNNATATTINTIGVAEKVAGTTVVSSLTRKFSHTNNRLTYTGALTRTFNVSVSLSLTSGSNNQVALYLAKNGSLITESEIDLTANSSGRFENGTTQALVSLETGDYIEVFVGNETATTDITVEFLNVIAAGEV